MERWRELCTRLDICDRKQVTGHVKGKVPDISFLIDRSSVPEPYLYVYYYYLFA